MMKTKHEIAQDIMKLLIESGMTTFEQLKILKDAKEKIDFVRKTANNMRSPELF